MSGNSVFVNVSEKYLLKYLGGHLDRTELFGGLLNPPWPPLTPPTQRDQEREAERLRVVGFKFSEFSREDQILPQRTKLK